MGIKPKAAPSSQSIKTQSIPNDTVRFTFKYYQTASEKFHANDRDPNYFLTLLERLKNVCTLTATFFRNNGSDALRSHVIGWEETTETDGFSCFNNQLKDYASSHAYQFSVSANAHGRVHGFLIDDLFYVVWLDPTHKLYP